MSKNPHPEVMYDSVTVSEIPRNARAVAGYIDGHFQTFPQLLRTFYPQAHCISISVLGNPAQCLDIEPGNVGPDSAGPWVKRMLALGHWKPILYASRSEMPLVRNNLDAHGLRRHQYRLWVADWTGTPHIPAGYDACQWTDHAMGRNLDQSMMAPSFWKPSEKPPVRHVTKRQRKPHRKVIGSVTGATVTSALLAVLNKAHVHVSAADMPVLVALGTFIAGYFTPSRK